MADRDKILIIADDFNKGVQLSSMLPLTRFDDKINVIVCQEIENFESVCSPKLLLLCVNKETVVGALRKIKSVPLLRYSKVLLVMEENDNELLCSAYDIGIDNFIIGYDETTLFLSVLLMLRSCSSLSNSEQNALMRDVLLDEKYLDSFMVYSYEKTFDSLNNYLEERKFDYNVLMISPSFEAKERVSESIMSATLINSIRGDDIPVSLTDHKFAIVFRTVDESRIKLFFEKLKNKYESLCPLFGVGAPIGKDLEFAFVYLQKLLDENIKTGLEYKYFESLEKLQPSPELVLEDTENDYLKSKGKFWKAFCELVTPYFFRTKTVMESKLPDSEIFDSIDKDETVFEIKQSSVSAKLKITYPAFSRINVNISFERNGEVKSHKEFFEPAEFGEQALDSLFAEFFDGYEMLIREEQNE